MSKNTWMMALKKWNSQQPGKWKVPKKGSPEHKQVKAIQSRIKDSNFNLQKGGGFIDDAGELIKDVAIPILSDLPGVLEDAGLPAKMAGLALAALGSAGALKAIHSKQKKK